MNYIFVRFSPFIWLTGFDFVVYPVVFLWNFIKLFKIDFFSLLNILLVAVLVFSAFSYLVSGGELYRFFGAINNIVVLLSSLGAYFICRSDDKAMLRMLCCYKYPFIISVFVYIVLSIFSYAGMTDLVFKSVFGLISPSDTKADGLLGRYQDLFLIIPDWLSFSEDSVGRVSFLGPYPNAAVAVIVLMGFCYRYFLEISVSTVFKKNSIDFLIFLVAIISLSRVAVLGYILGFMVSWFYILVRRIGIFKVGVPVLFFLVVLVVNTNIIDVINSLKEGSSSGRMILYTIALNQVFDVNPILGVGAKTTISQFGNTYPIGSHSTVISILYRGGIVSLIIFLMAYIVWPIYVVSKSSKYINKKGMCVIIRALCFFLMWMLVEDFDVSPIMTSCLMVIYACLGNVSRDILRDG